MLKSMIRWYMTFKVKLGEGGGGGDDWDHTLLKSMIRWYVTFKVNLVAGASQPPCAGRGRRSLILLHSVCWQEERYTHRARQKKRERVEGGREERERE